MRKKREVSALCSLLLALCLFSSLVFAAPPLMLANTYHPGIDLADYWVSEKMDGVRGYWDGKRLWTRAGNPVAAPAWFTAGWPTIPMDGELWAGRGRFDLASATVRALLASDEDWRQLRFMVFDLPGDAAVFDRRLQHLQRLLNSSQLTYLQAVSQARVRDHHELMQRLDAVVKAGGEGLMLHRGSSLYRGERNDDLLKLKPWDDAEAVVVAVLPGQGKYAGMMGALLVEMPSGQRFRLGTGFSDAERRQPPVPGARLTYRYRGFHGSGLPRFASFLRLRPAGE
ncbi:MAG: DNA ligase [Pedobacter sp.]|nr:DNA ligase [Pedobacter sp.]